jgi:hypothetical protein
LVLQLGILQPFGKEVTTKENKLKGFSLTRERAIGGLLGTLPER